MKKQREMDGHSDATGLGTLLEAGVLWLKTDSEVRLACERIDSCKVRQPFIHGELFGKPRELCELASKETDWAFGMVEFLSFMRRAKAAGIAV